MKTELDEQKEKIENAVAALQSFVDDYEEEDKERDIEKANTEYVVEQFADCTTLQDFQDKLKEITTRSYNFM